MKRFLACVSIIAIAVVLGIVPAMMEVRAADRMEPAKPGYGQQITVVQVFSAEEIAASGSATSDAIHIAGAVGYFSIQEEITGDGTLKLEYLVSLDGEDWIDPSGASDIATGQLKTSGSGSDGKDILSFTPELAPWIKIKATETGTSDTATITAYLAIQ